MRCERRGKNSASLHAEGSWWSGAEGIGKYSVCFTDSGKRRRNLNRTEAHMDHIHIGLSWAGARKPTSFWAAR